MSTDMWNGLQLTQSFAKPWDGTERRTRSQSDFHLRVGMIESKLIGMEHYVSGRGWLKRLLAWVLLSLVVAAGFFVQQNHIQTLESRMNQPQTVEAK